MNMKTIERLPDGKWIARDEETTLQIIFQDKRFNDTQEVSFLLEPIDLFKVPSIVNELTEWLAKYHRDKVE